MSAVRSVVYFVPLPLKEVLVKHIKGNDGKKLQELKKSNSLTERVKIEL
jgi:hypothetical protein